MLTRLYNWFLQVLLNTTARRLPLANHRFIVSSSSNIQDVNYDLRSQYEDISVPTLEEAVESLSQEVPYVMNYASIAKKKCKKDSILLTCDESAAIYLYTMPAATCICGFNAALRAGNRQVLRPWLGYIKLLMTALEKLPSTPTRTLLWRGVHQYEPENYIKDDVYIWWGVTSCSTSLLVVQNFVGDTGAVFHIEAIHGKDISMFSACPDENEVILMPGTRTRFKADSVNIIDRLFVIQLEEVYQPK